MQAKEKSANYNLIKPELINTNVDKSFLGLSVIKSCVGCSLLALFLIRKSFHNNRKSKSLAVRKPSNYTSIVKLNSEKSTIVPNAVSIIKTISDAQPHQSLEAYVTAFGGDRPIRRLLIANNGMGAIKAIRSMKQWEINTFGRRVTEYIAMASPEDMDCNAEYIRAADDFVPVPGGSNKNNYANVDLICDIAVAKGVDGVWPGWGHASENPELPRRLDELGIRFLGPRSNVMFLLGDKICANLLAQTAKIPSIPWSGDGLVVPGDMSQLTDISDELLYQSTVRTVEDAVERAKSIGYPIMTKASQGGGGKGIRMSRDEAELRAHFPQVCAEVPGSPVFMMQQCLGARHVEVQVVGDLHGNAAALNGRDCSTQRRFQKVFEEGPPTGPAGIVPYSIFKEMEEGAKRLVKDLKYSGAGTVEYLYNPEKAEFYFLELNPRLQVEHPVTELVTNINLPAAQLQIAMGIPLHNIPDIRDFFCEGPQKLTLLPPKLELVNSQRWVQDSNACGEKGRYAEEQYSEGKYFISKFCNIMIGRQPIIRPTNSFIDPDTYAGLIPLTKAERLSLLASTPVGPEILDQPYRVCDGHIIAARITGENPDEGFKPTSGSVSRIEFQSSPNVWGYFSLGPNGGIHEFADSQMGHIFAKGATREEARVSLIGALTELKIVGAVRTPVETLIDLLKTTEFKNNTLDTSWLDGLIFTGELQKRSKSYLPGYVAVCAALVRAFEHSRSVGQEIESHLSRGQVAEIFQLAEKLRSIPVNIVLDNINYNFDIRRTGRNGFSVKPVGFQFTNDEGIATGTDAIEVEVLEQPTKELSVKLGHSVHMIGVYEDPLGLRLTLSKLNGKTVLIPMVNDPSKVTSEVTGKLLRYLKNDGDDVKSGEAIAEVEAMKMVMEIRAAAAGKIKNQLGANSPLAVGDLVASIEIADGVTVEPVIEANGQVNVGDLGHMVPGRLLSDLSLTDAKKILEVSMHGYELPHHIKFEHLLDKLCLGRSSTRTSTGETSIQTMTRNEIMTFLLSLIDIYSETHAAFKAQRTDQEAMQKMEKSPAELLQLALARTDGRKQATQAEAIINKLQKWSKDGDDSIKKDITTCMSKVLQVYNGLSSQAHSINKSISKYPTFFSGIGNQRKLFH